MGNGAEVEIVVGPGSETGDGGDGGGKDVVAQLRWSVVVGR